MRLPLLYDAILEPKARCFLAGNKSIYGMCMILNRQSPISSPKYQNTRRELWEVAKHCEE
jgi:hypothetical protein